MMSVAHENLVTCPAPTRALWSFSGVMAAFRGAFAARKQRHDLRRLDPHLLDDIGISARDAEAEATRPLWDVPRHWQR